MNTVEELQDRLDPTKRRFARSIDLLNPIDRIECADGFNMSVQAGNSLYCHPRDNYGPWFAVEVGFPSKRVEEFMEYIDGDDSKPTDTVYGYVPLTTVAAVIDAHGGFKP